jgi:hypothetical protein
MEPTGRWLAGLGVVLAAIGVLLIASAYLGLPLGRLPGDLRIERPGLRLYLPLGTCVLLSAVVSLVFWVLTRLR